MIIVDDPMARDFLNAKRISLLFLISGLAFLFISGCGIHRYNNPELLKKPVVSFPKEYETIVVPLDSELVPIAKQIFLLRNDVADMKNKLWDGGSNQRVTRIDNNIDTARKEISALSGIRKELLNTIYYINPGYVEAEVVPYKGENAKHKKTEAPVILVTLQDQRAYIDAKENGEKLSQTIVYKPLIRTAMRQFESLPDSLKPKIQPIGSPGPVRRLEPYEPPRPK
jgi:hypothetical protein